MLYSAIPRPDAPVIYTGVFPILIARPGRRSIYNKRSFNFVRMFLQPSRVESSGEMSYMLECNIVVSTNKIK